MLVHYGNYKTVPTFSHRSMYMNPVSVRLQPYMPFAIKSSAVY